MIPLLIIIISGADFLSERGESFTQCNAQPHSYRYTLDDLYPMMNAVRQRAESYDEWASKVTEVMEAKLDKKRSEFHSENW